MAYAVISYWTNDDFYRDSSYAAARERFAPALKALGAISTHFIATSPGTFQVFTLYPDEATANAAMAKLEEIRAQACRQFPVLLVTKTQGEVFASA